MDPGQPPASSSDAPTGTSLAQAASGFALLFDGFGVLRRQRSLWPLAAIPVAFSLLALLAATSILVIQADWIFSFVTQWVPVLEVGAWYTWLWIGPGKLLLLLLRGLLFVAGAGAVLLACVLLANLLAAPALDALSSRVESLVGGRVEERDEPLITSLAGDVARSMSNEARRLLLLVGVWGALLAVGAVVPGGQLVAPLLLLLFTLLFLPLEYAGHVLDRRRVPFRGRRAWLRRHLPRMLGFGAAAFLTCLVPGLNFLLLPVLVVSGTLLAVRYPPLTPS